jgi:hypothetical protein
MLCAVVEPEDQQSEGDEADRKIHEEHPAPVESLRHDATDRWTDDGRDDPDAAEETLHLGALFQVEEVADHGEAGRQECARAEALQRAVQDELVDRAREAAQHRARDEADQGEEVHAFPPEDV